MALIKESQRVQHLMELRREELVERYLAMECAFKLEEAEALWLDKLANGYRDGFDEDESERDIAQDYKDEVKRIKEQYSNYYTI